MTRRRDVWIAVLAAALTVWFLAVPEGSHPSGPGATAPAAVSGAGAAPRSPVMRDVAGPSVPPAALASRAAPSAALAAPAAAPRPSAPAPTARQAPQAAPDLAPRAAAAVLMDATTGQVLWEKNEHRARPVASITKLMTMALVMDAISAGRLKWSDRVSITPEAADTPGATAFLSAGDRVTVRNLFIALSVMSANDASVALAERVGGSEARFVQQMNATAGQLGMAQTVYRNPHGIDVEGHVSTAYDVALISRYLISHHPDVLGFTSMWDYWFENAGQRFWLTNTNKLLKQYPGLDGLKTGWTTAAGYGLAATAKRGSTRLIAVALGFSTAKERNQAITDMLNYGFGHYATVLVARRGETLTRVLVGKGAHRFVGAAAVRDAGATVPRGAEASVTSRVSLPAEVPAPVAAGQTLGDVVVMRDGQEVDRVPLTAVRAVSRAGLGRLFVRLFLRQWPWLAR